MANVRRVKEARRDRWRDQETERQEVHVLPGSTLITKQQGKDQQEARKETENANEMKVTEFLGSMMWSPAFILEDEMRLCRYYCISSKIWAKNQTENMDWKSQSDIVWPLCRSWFVLRSKKCEQKTNTQRMKVRATKAWDNTDICGWQRRSLRERKVIRDLIFKYQRDGELIIGWPEASTSRPQPQPRRPDRSIVHSKDSLGLDL